MGVRSLRRAIEGHVTSALADLIVRKDPPAGTTIVLLVENNRVVARLAGSEEAWEVQGSDARSPQMAE